MNFHKITTFLFLLAGTQVSFCQSPYQFEWKKETAIATLGLGGWVVSRGLESNLHPLTAQAIADLDRNDLLSIDRHATYNDHPKAHTISNFFFYSAPLVPFALLADKSIRSDSKEIAALYGETILLASGLTLLTKNLAHRPRPFVYNQNVPLADKQTLNARQSFFSGHASMTAALSFFTAKVYADYHPDSRWKPLVWSAAAALPALTGYLRVRGGKHFPTDVATGYAVGAAVGILVPQLHRKKDWKGGNIQSGIGLNSAYFSMTF